VYVTASIASPCITDLAALVKALPDRTRETFDRIFLVSSTSGELVPPDEMSDWITGHFGSVDAVRRQRIVRVTNKVTMDGALFNGLRARRPLDAPSSGGDRSHKASGAISGDLAETIAGSKGGPFCHPQTQTPADTFGRIRGKSSTTASNVAKYDGWHAVIVFDEHNPLHFSADQVSDYVDTAQEWSRAAHAADAEACYPFFLWNCLWRSGASIVHGHAQMTLTRGMHYAKVEALRQASLRYRAEHGSDYLADLVAVHRALGLACDHGSATLLPSLTPFKEKETHIVGQCLDADLKSALYVVLRTFIGRLGVESFNLALYQPPLSRTPETWEGFPFIFRVIDRGSLASQTSDVGAMEFFGQSVVATDPFRIVDALRAVQKLSPAAPVRDPLGASV
jgi:hypothetical protein